MARVNIEERFFSEIRLKKFSELMGWDIQKSIGTLCLIWMESQEAMRLDASSDDILLWARLKSRKDRAGLIAALSHDSVRYVHLTQSGSYEIHGNYPQLDNRIKNIRNSKKGGEATQQKWEIIKNQQLEKNGEGRPASPAASQTASRHQALAVQSSADQTSALGVVTSVTQGPGSENVDNSEDAIERRYAELCEREAKRRADKGQNMTVNGLLGMIGMKGRAAQ